MEGRLRRRNFTQLIELEMDFSLSICRPQGGWGSSLLSSSIVSSMLSEDVARSRPTVPTPSNGTHARGKGFGTTTRRGEAIEESCAKHL
ncbi:hypothetical protein TNCT_311951 [Trichonephila clavata]|uniref:Uncharacterized protein n=1 Tax=Trichonephila clavata TaxID=2740835 RepID=A0A8X6GLD8_TRICU|nr:hypothetical protein TNCT_311951 [Trichonephila clavata]